jgi:hypothetical protein
LVKQLSATSDELLRTEHSKRENDLVAQVNEVSKRCRETWARMEEAQARAVDAENRLLISDKALEAERSKNSIQQAALKLIESATSEKTQADMERKDGVRSLDVAREIQAAANELNTAMDAFAVQRQSGGMTRSELQRFLKLVEKADICHPSDCGAVGAAMKNEPGGCTCGLTEAFVLLIERSQP